MATVEIQNMTKRYGTITAVDDMSLSLGDGEFFVVLGPSGAARQPRSRASRASSTSTGVRSRSAPAGR